MATVERNFKDTLFRMVFREKQELLSLYNALNGTNYPNPDELEINTLENAVYMNLKNDISFIFGFELSLYEHQSTYSPNMPLRNLFYVSRLLEKTIADQTLYTSASVKIPTPRFFVFYNGIRQQPEKKQLKLSDAFQKRIDNPDLELTVTMLNINAGYNQELQAHCKTLKDYICYVQKVRTYAKEMDLTQAVAQAVNECIDEDILRKFLVQYKAEVIQMSILEYDEEKEMVKIRRAEYEYGVEEGRLEGRQEGRLEADAKFIFIIRRKLEKKLNTKAIAEILELDESYINQILALILKYPDYTDIQIAKELKNIQPA